MKYIQTPHNVKLYTLNANFNPVYSINYEACEFINNKNKIIINKLKQKSTSNKGNKIVIDFAANRKNDTEKVLQPGRFFYYVLDLDYKNIGHKMCLISEFNLYKHKIDLLYYLKSSKDLCSSFFSCNKNKAEKKIILLYKEVTDKLLQTKIDNNLNINSIVNRGQIEDYFIKCKNENSQKSSSKKLKLNR